MLHSGCSLFGDTWDTNRACQFLKISDEELLLLDSIPGWEKVHEESDVKQTSESENPHTMENLSIPLQISIPVNTATEQPNKEIQNPNVGRNILVPNSDPSQEKSTITPSTDKDNFMHNISLFFNKAKEVFSSLPRKRSRSASDIHLLKVNESLSSSKSETDLMNISHNMSEQLVSNKAKKSKWTKLIPVPLEDKTNNNQTFTDIHCKKNSKIPSKKETFENLEDILNHSYLKKTLPIQRKSETNDIPSTTEKIDLCREQLKRKLELLQKRFSQSGKCDMLSPHEGNIKNNFDFESIGSEKQFPAVSELAEKVSETQTGETYLSNSNNSSKEINPSTDYNSSTNTMTSSAHDIQSPGKTKQSESHPTATVAENEAVVKLFSNVPDDKSCTSQQSKLNPVVIHLSKSGDVPPSSDSHSFLQQNSINQSSESNSEDAESNVSAPCVITLSTDAHSFAHPHSVDQPVTAKSKDVDGYEPVPYGISSSTDTISSGQPSFKSHPEMLLKSEDVSVSVPGDIPQSTGAHFSIQSDFTNSEVKSSIHCTSSPSKMSSAQIIALSHLLISKMKSPLKFKSPESCVDSATSLATDSQTFMGSCVVNRPEATSLAKDEDSVKVTEAEKQGAAFSDFSDNPSGCIASKSSAPREILKATGKRKREIKGDHKPHKKLSLSNSTVDIQYTAEQVKNMIEIMRFQFKM